MADSNDGHLMTFKVNLEDREKFPELIDVLYVSLWEDDEGFVHSSVLERSE